MGDVAHRNVQNQLRVILVDLEVGKIGMNTKILMKMVRVFMRGKYPYIKRRFNYLETKWFAKRHSPLNATMCKTLRRNPPS
eukprot:COSAG02_NODE_76_length_41115_cov_60.967817_21_plen_81_part_00